jgi:peptidoglycan/LPS O-acetylase OafA/YrhL
MPSNPASELTALAPDPAAPPASGWDRAESPTGRGHFRPDIEGLRAVAILAVLAFHAGVPFLRGGFVGVDVFFVISGFLITGLLMREHGAHGRINLAGFYARRARRLLPAALLVIAVTMGASILFLSVLRHADVAGDAAAAALYVSNYRFALTATDYFAADTPPSPLLHFWSLGVEEQFYLFWPLLLIAALRLFGPRRIWIGVAIVTVASFIASVVVTGIEPAWAFYSLPTRAWQIGLGSLIAAALVARPVLLPRTVALVLGPLGLLCIGAAVVLIDDRVAYPGWWALLPVLGAVMVVLAGEHDRTPTGSVLSSAVPRFFGRISYSLYLWHWPLLVIVPIALDRGGLRLKLVLALVAIGVAVLSTRYVENPFRGAGRSVKQATNRRTLVTAGLLSLALATSTMLVAGNVTSPQAGPIRLPALPEASGAPPAVLTPLWVGALPADVQPPLIDAPTDRGDLGPDQCQTPSRETALRDCAYGPEDAATTVVLFGDSHAGMWLPAAQRLAEANGWRVIPLVKFGCTPVEFTVWDNTLKRAFTECDEWRDMAIARIQELQPDLTLMVTSRGYEISDEDGNPLADGKLGVWRDRYVETLRRLETMSRRVVVIGETPHMPEDPLECIARHQRLEDCEVPFGVAVHEEYRAMERAAAAEAGVQLIDTIEWVCPGDRCPLVLGDYLVYRNPGHLTATMTAALAPQLQWALEHPG